MTTAFTRSLARIGAIAAKEALHIRRDPRTLYLALGMPVVMLLLFGYGVGFDLDHLPLAIYDADGTPASRDLVAAFTRAGEFQAVTMAQVSDGEALMRSGQVLGALVISRGYEQKLARGENASVQLLVDGSDGVVANQVLTKADLVGRAAALRGARLRGEAPISVRVWTRFNPTGRSALFMIPGLSAYLLAISAVLLTALTIASEWERGSMEQLFASPAGRLDIILGKLLPYLVLGLLQFLLVVAVGTSVFDVPLRGSIVLLFAVGVLFLAGMLGQGLLISVVAKNQLVATQGGAIIALLPAMLLSGMLFPVDNMPTVLQWLSRVVPARYLVHALRALFLKGSGLGALWPDLAALTVFAFAIIAVATARFRRRIA